MRPLSAPRSSPSREQAPRPHKRGHKTHKAQGKALSSTLQPSGATEQPKQAKRGGRESKKRRTTQYYQSHKRSDSEEHPPRENSASSSKARTQFYPSPQRPGAQPAHRQDKIDQEWEEEAGEDREFELTHTYRIKEKVYNAVSEAIRAGHKLDHNRTTWGLSQLHPATALSILSNLSHPMYTSSQQYVDHCVGDGWHADSTHQRGHPQTQHEVQGLSAQAPRTNQGRHKKPQDKK